MHATPYKGPILHLQPYIIKIDRKYNLEPLATSFPNIGKWTSNSTIDNDLSNNFWTNPNITTSQITRLLKFRYNQYMGNARKQLFFGPALYPSITCSLCHSRDIDTWPHLLLSCNQPYIHALRIKRHNKAVATLRKLLVSSTASRSFILMNAGTFNDSSPDNTVPL
jgi:hypothetical protein